MKNHIKFISIICFQLHCTSPKIINIDPLAKEKIQLHDIFNSQDSIKIHCADINSLYEKLHFKVSCEYIQSLNLMYYNKAKLEADNFENSKPLIVDGNFDYPCDLRKFELLRRSCIFNNPNAEQRVQLILDTIDRQLNRNEIISVDGTLLSLSIKELTAEKLIYLYTKNSSNKKTTDFLFSRIYLSIDYNLKYFEIMHSILNDHINEIEIYKIRLYQLSSNIPPEKKNQLNNFVDSEITTINNNTNLSSNDKKILYKLMEGIKIN